MTRGASLAAATNRTKCVDNGKWWREGSLYLTLPCQSAGETSEAKRRGWNEPHMIDV